ncbi:hypothetical protein PQX77_006705 [Marasmius sp. AFHP31]|nr:hypothetical protein PQX77_006705 [Marasmius sp. AFHP31]
MLKARAPLILAPARLKKELSKVLQLQEQIDSLEEEIAEVKSAKLHARLKQEAEGLYGSLDIKDQYPQLKGIPLEDLHTLVLAWDLKITIRKKAIGSFFEWDHLDQAMGGADQALGTRAHQLTRNSISRHVAAFEGLICKYNQHVTYLEETHKPAYGIAVPKRLPTQLASLRDMETSHLWEDVSVTQSEDPPEYLINENTRKEIRALLNLDRCAEERVRLDAELKNLCAWYYRELQALMFMTRDDQYRKYHTALRMRLYDHLLAELWANPFVSVTTFRNMVTSIERWLGRPPPPSTPTSFTTSSPRLSAPTTPHSMPRLVPHSPAPSTRPLTPRKPCSSVARSTSPTPLLPTIPPTVPEDDDNEDEDFEITGIRLALEDVMADGEPDDDDYDGLTLRWELPVPLLVDATLWPGVRNQSFPPFNHTAYAPHSFYSLVQVQHVFHAPQYRRLDGANQWLDEDCINGCAALLQQQLYDRNVDCAVLSTFIVPEVLGNGICTETAWRIVCHTQYWSKPIWVIPVHNRDEHHWALAVVRIAKEEIQLFDSFGSHEFVTKWLRKIQLIVNRLVAGEHGRFRQPDFSITGTIAGSGSFG